jgi:truncated hemoglobin YjbI
MATPTAPATADPVAQHATESGLTAAQRRALLNLFKGAQTAIDSPAKTRLSERAILLALVERAAAILKRGGIDAEREVLPARGVEEAG